MNEFLIDAHADEICRTCKRFNRKDSNVPGCSNEIEFYSLYDFVNDCEDNEIEIIELLNRVVPILPKIEMHDALPKTICTDCLKKLSTYEEFQNCCIKSDQDFRNCASEKNVLRDNFEDPLQCFLEKEIKQEQEQEEFLDESNNTGEDEQYQENYYIYKQEDESKIDETENEIKLQQKDGEQNLIALDVGNCREDDQSKSKCIWRCEDCNLTFLFRNHLRLHFERDANTCEEKYQRVYTERFECFMCNSTFSDKRNCVRHMLSKHNMDVRIKVKEPLGYKPKTLKNVEDPSTMEILAQSLSLNNFIKLENEDSNNLGACEAIQIVNVAAVKSEDIPSQTQQSKIQKQNILENPEYYESDKSILESGTENFKIWECKKCSNVFYHKKNLSRHMKSIHNEELPKDTQPVSGIDNFKKLTSIYKCDECDRVFHQMSSLTLHKHAHLNPGASKTCQYCNKTFTKLYKLKVHERNHTKETPFLCSVCGKSFAGRENLAQHCKRHSSEKQYQCPHCPKKFFASSDLCSHIRQVHDTSKPFACEICGTAFKRFSCLKKHKSTVHSVERRYKCQYCDRRFRDKEHMQRHRRTHTGEKPYSCQYCSRCFNNAGDLRKHLTNHLGGKSYFCELCPAVFRLARELQTHFATHKHDDDETKARNKKALLEAQEKMKVKFAKKSDQKQTS